MKKLAPIFISLIFAILTVLTTYALFATGIVSAQDNKSTPKPQELALDTATGDLTIQRTITATANVALTIGDQLYQLRVPVAIQIDAATPLTAAQVSAPAANQVGVLVVNPLSLEVLEGDYDKGYRDISPTGEDNVLAVYTAEITNLHNETINPGYSDALTTLAIDETGQTYEEKEKVCDEIDPGETATCEIIFDVPATANLIDLQVQTMAIKRFSFPQTKTQ